MIKYKKMTEELINWIKKTKKKTGTQSGSKRG